MHIAEPYSRTEEIAHSLTAASGVAALLLGIPWLVVRAAYSTGSWRVIGVLAFGCGGLLMFATSTLYHAARRPASGGVYFDANERVQEVWNRPNSRPNG